MSRVFHVALRDDWERALQTGSYRTSTLGSHLDDVGFIHLGFAHQVKPVADARYRGMSDLVLLELDSDRLGDLVRVEAVPDSTERFPHLYREIVPADVRAVHPFVAGPDGLFDPVS